MTNKRIRKWLPLVVAALLLLAIGGFVAFVALGSYLEGGTGSMAEARRLRPVVEAMPSPTKSGTDYEAEALRIVFPNGEWVVGVAKNSHGMYSQLTGGGTVVLRDSRGRVRCFFGHVCGSGRIGQDTPKVDSLDGLDEVLSKKFVEQTWP